MTAIEDETQEPAPAEPTWRRTPAKRKARELAKYLRGERPDYAYLKEVSGHLRDELGIDVQRAPKRLPYVPSDDEIRRYYETVWKARRGGDIVLIKTLLYTGVRVAELVAIRIDDVDLDACRIRITQGKGAKDRYVPFPDRVQGDSRLYTSRPSGPRGRAPVRVQLEEAVHRPRCREPSSPATPTRPVSPQHGPPQAPPLPLHLAQDPRHRRRPHPALLGHESRQSLEIYSRIALADAQKEYQGVIERFPV